MGQEITMVHSFVYVTSCVLAIIIGIYLRALLEARKVQRTRPMKREDLENRQSVLRQMRGVLWGMVGVIALGTVIGNDLLR